MGMGLLKAGVRRNLGNGMSIKIFQDPWIPRPVTFKILMNRGHDNENLLVAEFITSSVRWDVSKLHQYLCREDVEVITQLPISRTAPDTWVWHYDKNGKYTVKSGYKLCMLSSQATSSSYTG